VRSNKPHAQVDELCFKHDYVKQRATTSDEKSVCVKGRSGQCQTQLTQTKEKRRRKTNKKKQNTNQVLWVGVVFEKKKFGNIPVVEEQSVALPPRNVLISVHMYNDTQQWTSQKEKRRAYIRVGLPKVKERERGVWGGEGEECEEQLKTDEERQQQKAKWKLML
jgi:hypothetical protein